MKILVLNALDETTFKTFFTEDVLEALKTAGTVDYFAYDGSTAAYEALLDRMEDVDAIITTWGVPTFDKRFYERAKQLKIIAHTGGSVADMVSEDLEKRNIILMSGNRFYAKSVAEGTIGYMLMGQRKLYPVVKYTEDHGWRDWTGYTSVVNGLRDKVIGVVGLGMISEHLVKMLGVFGVRKILIYTSHGVPEEMKRAYPVEESSLEEIFQTADIVSLHSAMTEKNYHMVNARLLGMMKDDALLVNTARGGIIKEADLEKELKTGRIRAVLDVYETEPLPLDSGLRGLQNVTLIPHMGGPTTDVRRLVTLGLIEDIKKYADGETVLENQISISYAKNMTSHSAVAHNSRKEA